MTPNHSNRAPKFNPSAIELGPASNVLKPRPAAAQEISFYNGLGRACVVVYRSGLQVMIPHTVNASRQGLMVRLSYFNSNAVNVHTSRLLNDDGSEGTVEGQKLAEAVRRNQTEWHSTASANMQAAHVDYLMSLEDLEQHGGSVYIESLDIVVTLHSYDQAPAHPASLTGMREGLMSQSTGGLNYRVEIYDQDGVFGQRYMNVGGEVFLVKPVTDGQRRDGVYFSGNHPLMAGGAQTERCRYVPLDEADKKLPLYRSHNEALTLGNPSDIYKRELEELQHELRKEEVRIKQEDRQRQIDYDKQRRALEQEKEDAAAQRVRDERVLQDRKAELERIKFQLESAALLRKDEYERRTANRQEWSDAVKIIPIVLTLIAAGYGAYKKYVDK